MMKSLACLLLMLSPLVAVGQWQLDSETSTVRFVSIKNDSVAETHRFRQLQGGIDADGEARLRIDLASVDTGIPVRDQRMRELLFAVTEHPDATVRASLAPDRLAQLAQGRLETWPLALTLDLHGEARSIETEVQVLRDTDDRLHVRLARPLLVNAADHGLADGIEALREVAGLSGIALAVPIDIELVFAPLRCDATDC
jgi:polyisoprenoid-binding protein YceI